MKRILVVDEDVAICSAVKACLKSRPYDVVTADGGARGLAAIEITSFDLLIVDVFMPHMNGFQSIREFRQEAPDVPLIAMSGYVFAEQRVETPDFFRMALAFGATRCLRKPFTPRALLSVIEACLARSSASLWASLPAAAKSRVARSFAGGGEPDRP